ncbi:hypothetical protein [Kitasatospora cineracea]|uniref:hypothetical protein n=1 Tax=Kitasatospora cineracea TaxID=88074 RepID=UPI0037FA0F6A
MTGFHVDPSHSPAEYGSAFQDPHNKVNHLEIITNDTKSAACFGALTTARNVPGETLVVP